MLQLVFVMLLVTLDLSSCLDKASLDAQWKQWKITYGKEYRDENEEVHRRDIWERNKHMIEVHNQEAEQGKHSYKLEMNRSGDLMSDNITMVENKYEEMSTSEILDEVAETMAKHNGIKKHLILKDMTKMIDDTNKMSQNHIFMETMEKMEEYNEKERNEILKEMSKMTAKYDSTTRLHMLKEMSETIDENVNMHKTLVLVLKIVTKHQEMSRLQIMLDMAKKMDEHNSMSRSQILEEMAKKMAEYDMMPRSPKSEQTNISCFVPKSIDYRKEGLVTPVKDQGDCESCWAFSAAGALEGQLAKKTGRLLNLSTQNLVDCVEESDGCERGYRHQAFEYVQENGGMNSEEDYPYTGTVSHCRYNRSAIAAQCKGFEQVPRGNECALADALYEVGPLSVAINLGDKKFVFYKSGIYYNPECYKDKLNHAMLLVGYGETAKGEQYWIVKNSHGESWGEKGYMRIARNRGNHCGIANKAMYPIM